MKDQLPDAIDDVLTFKKPEMLEVILGDIKYETPDDRQDFFKPKTDNICDHCHWMQFKINDKAIPCKRCRHYVG